ncbi:ArgP/LysG family DNA-binding transcriptional regulator [Actinoplanes sp. ATCC 53533]|uniref:LysR family transcriptional regulator ArgP n=1 Tax=Actinoplanes sp. ATCC 53533 TaxID=1288362 RepID=UPI000F78D521|nr:LysR family transcriptional regulator ArgP [Actinoplanes sp. ATCC 53533]RSM67860.1 ArgP/LysG family DNA-binding transcriptional regulator [Actinoplanes sp. ATCC 53533]
MDAIQLATFQAVIEDGSFEAAARTLHVTPSAVSQRIKALEQAVGQVLVRRTKPCEATEAGQPLVRLAGQLALLEREALDAARGGLAGGGRTRISVVVNADSLHNWFMPALAAIPAELALSFDLHQDDEDYTAELLRAGTAMAAVTAQHVAVKGCRVEKLGAMRYLAVAAPGHFADFATTPMLVFNRKDRLQHRFLAALGHGGKEPPIHYVPAANAFVEAIRLGLGWGMVPEQTAREDFAAGRGVDLAPGRHMDVPLYWQYWRMESTVLTALTTAVKAVAAGALR